MLPIKHIQDRRIEVTTRLQDATLMLVDANAPVTSLNGFLTIRQTLPAAGHLEGRWLGGPLRVTVEHIDAGTPAANVTASGHATAEQLTRVLHLPSAVKIDGATNWRFTTRLEAATLGAGPGVGPALVYPNLRCVHKGKGKRKAVDCFEPCTQVVCNPGCTRCTCETIPDCVP